MTVVVQLPQALAEDAGGHRELAFELAPTASLADLLADVQARHPALGRRLCDETGTVVLVAGSVAGG